jgi:carbonic anhydrase/acetyltransferase-like protein (isoleucine patch superfamily)
MAVAIPGANHNQRRLPPNQRGIMIETINKKTPQVDPTAFIAPGAVVLGDVELGLQASVWYGCVLRGDINWIRVGAKTNLQDGVIIHVAHRGQGTHVGSEVEVPAGALAAGVPAKVIREITPEQRQATLGMMERYLEAAVMHGELLRRHDATGGAD